MAKMGRPGLSTQQKDELWARWKAGQSISDIGRSLGKHAGSVFGVLLAKGGIAPPARVRSRVALLLQDREEISRGLVAGLSLRRLLGNLGGRHQRSAAKSVEIMEHGSIGLPMLMSELGAGLRGPSRAFWPPIDPCGWWWPKN